MASASLLPTVTANISIVLSLSVSADIQTHWLAQKIGAAGSLNSPIDDTETELSIQVSAGSTPGAFGFATLAPGNTLLIDGEAMEVLAVDGAAVAVARNVAPQSPAGAAHASGAPVYVLKYRDPWQMIADEALRPWAQQIVIGLGASSATFGAQASGSLALTEAA